MNILQQLLILMNLLFINSVFILTGCVRVTVFTIFYNYLTILLFFMDLLFSEFWSYNVLIWICVFMATLIEPIINYLCNIIFIFIFLQS
jgi:hypothetical protein